jgi:Phytanoyl-CoA dioxygenase (PhyH)
MPPVNNPFAGVPLVESPLFDQLLDAGIFPPEVIPIARSLHDHGYAILDFPDVDFNARAERIKSRLKAKVEIEQDSQFILDGQRLTDLWIVDEDVRELAVNENILALLTTLYGRRAYPAQTLNFPKGSQQHYHMDSYYFSSIPERYLCGVWVALEDIGINQGPLLFYPGSQKFPSYTYDQVGLSRIDYDFTTQYAMHPAWDALISLHKLQPRHFLARKGQALIWTANLLHGGELHFDQSQTRWSQVTHYFFEDCAYHIPSKSDLFHGRIEFIEAMDIVTKRVVPASFNKEPVPRNFLNAAIAGHHEHRRERFDGAAYLRANPDVLAAGVDPWLHFVEYGRNEGRLFHPLLSK